MNKTINLLNDNNYITINDVVYQQEILDNYIRNNFSLHLMCTFYSEDKCKNKFIIQGAPFKYTKKDLMCYCNIKGNFINLIRFIKFLKDKCEIDLEFLEQKINNNIYQLEFTCNYEVFLSICNIKDF